MNSIVRNLPKERQTLLFSATQTKSVRALARLSLSDPEYVAVHEQATLATPDKLTQHYMVVEAPRKFDMLFSFIRTHLKAKCIVFVSSCKQVRYMWEVFRRVRPGVPLMAIHGQQKQNQRLAIYYDFLEKPAAVLFATDIAARGLDFPDLDWVVQFDCPDSEDSYIHRVGRTARYRAGGHALTMLLPSEEKMVDLLKQRKVPIKRVRPNMNKLVTVTGQFRSFLSVSPDLKYLAQKAFISYLRSVHLQSNKEVFKVNEMPLEEIADAMGLPGMPRVKFLRKSRNAQKNMPYALRELLAQEKEREKAKKAKGKDGSSATSTKQRKDMSEVERLLTRQNVTVFSKTRQRMIADDEEDDSSEDEFLQVKRVHRYDQEDSDDDDDDDDDDAAGDEEEEEQEEEEQERPQRRGRHGRQQGGFKVSSSKQHLLGVPAASSSASKRHRRKYSGGSASGSGSGSVSVSGSNSKNSSLFEGDDGIDDSESKHADAVSIDPVRRILASKMVSEPTVVQDDRGGGSRARGSMPPTRPRADTLNREIGNVEHRMALREQQDRRPSSPPPPPPMMDFSGDALVTEHISSNDSVSSGSGVQMGAIPPPPIRSANSHSSLIRYDELQVGVGDLDNDDAAESSISVVKPHSDVPPSLRRYYSPSDTTTAATSGASNAKDDDDGGGGAKPVWVYSGQDEDGVVHYREQRDTSDKWQQKQQAEQRSTRRLAMEAFDEDARLRTGDGDDDDGDEDDPMAKYLSPDSDDNDDDDEDGDDDDDGGEAPKFRALWEYLTNDKVPPHWKDKSASSSAAASSRSLPRERSRPSSGGNRSDGSDGGSIRGSRAGGRHAQLRYSSNRDTSKSRRQQQQAKNRSLGARGHRSGQSNSSSASASASASLSKSSLRKQQQRTPNKKSKSARGSPRSNRGRGGGSGKRRRGGGSTGNERSRSAKGSPRSGKPVRSPLAIFDSSANSAKRPGSRDKGKGGPRRGAAADVEYY
eukprot:TRINITY_DN66145_c5_g3_i4.p1 TRINITY_DN66145_c5_g3~~TRINITY_DN66145_c5_g3_i4.p1  ORF type:complete len:981 (-),score=472.78 TRINITY_DN66145_c5_g3_i4:652-3594(-)